MAEYTIKEVSEMFSLPASTLRYYEEIGILTNIPRNSSGNRVYQECHIARLRTICCFKNTGMSMAQLQAFFSYECSNEDHVEDIIRLLAEHKDSLAKKIEQLQRDYIHVQRKLHFYQDIKKSRETQMQPPVWEDYKYQTFAENEGDGADGRS
ncbi:MAG: MerR family transcriptional regulator [Lachnospiraceae bacterium]|nr:MerR family transcriptional regulator [Lachnospiraceae bacterium]